MKTLADLESMITLCAKDWYAHQVRNPHTTYYWYYMESTAEHDGGLIVCSVQPPNKDYKLACSEQLRRDWTPEQNANYFRIRYANSLPVMSIR